MLGQALSIHVLYSCDRGGEVEAQVSLYTNDGTYMGSNRILYLPSLRLLATCFPLEIQHWLLSSFGDEKLQSYNLVQNLLEIFFVFTYFLMRFLSTHGGACVKTQVSIPWPRDI